MALVISNHIVKTFFTTIFAFLAVSTLYAWWIEEIEFQEYRLNNEGSIFVEGKEISISIADTSAKRALGLSNLAHLPQGHGLLFEFQNEGLHGIWMKDMMFPIDIVWLSREFVVVTIAENVSPDTYPETFYSKSPALYVLELNAGQARNLGLFEGKMLE
jgi:uncharacterized protein